MNIGFDAKRAFHNVTGLGNYSRTLIESLATYYPNEHYYLFNPKPGTLFKPTSSSVTEINPVGFIDKLIPTFWRSYSVIKEINQLVDIYHGLSNELPMSSKHSRVKKVVTIHDVIYESFPEQYRKQDVAIYRKKTKHACEVADTIVAISEATKSDLIELYKIDEAKIEVCYQSCDERFFKVDETNSDEVRKKYHLHKPYFLSVGSIIERKNLLNICKAFREVQEEFDCDLVIVGKGNGKYKESVINYVAENNLSNKVHFLEDKFKRDNIFQDLPMLYYSSLALVYPSKKEGFGIPVLEAMAAGTAVITSNVSSLKEIGEDAAQCVNPESVSEMYDAMKKIVNDNNFRLLCIAEGKTSAAKYSNQKSAESIMNIYKKLIAL